MHASLDVNIQSEIYNFFIFDLVNFLCWVREYFSGRLCCIQPKIMTRLHVNRHTSKIINIFFRKLRSHIQHSVLKDKVMICLTFDFFSRISFPPFRKSLKIFRNVWSLPFFYWFVQNDESAISGQGLKENWCNKNPEV